MKEIATSLKITSEQLNKELVKQNPLLLFDIRNKKDFEKSHIQGSVHAVCDAKAKEKIIPNIPKNTKIVLISEPDEYSSETAKMMVSFGLDAYYLEGGLAGWNQILKPITITQNPKVIQVQKIGKGCLSHIVESDGDAVIIDPLYPVQKYIDIAKKQGFEITKIFDTHQHADHVSAARELAKKTNAKLYLSKYEGYDYDANFVEDGDIISFGKSKLRVIHTPGHTPGSLGFVVDEKYVFTGDILFVESIGRPDLRDKAEELTEQLYNTLHEKLLNLPDEILVFPTHYGKDANPIDESFYSTIEKSKKLPLLDISKQDFIKKITAITMPRPMNYRRIIAVNKGELELVQSDIPDMEIGPNRCAVNAT